MDGAQDMPHDETNNGPNIQSPGLKFVFNPNRDNFPNNPCPYNEDGDPNMYSKENMAKRKALRANPIVRNAIEDFMSSFSLNRDGSCSKDEYFNVFIKIGTILRPNIEPDDLNQIIKEDFELDSQDPRPDVSEIEDKD